MVLRIHFCSSPVHHRTCQTSSTATLWNPAEHWNGAFIKIMRTAVDRANGWKKKRHTKSGFQSRALHLLGPHWKPTAWCRFARCVVVGYTYHYWKLGVLIALACKETHAQSIDCFVWRKCQCKYKIYMPWSAFKTKGTGICLMTSNLSLRTALESQSKQNIAYFSHQSSLLLLDFMMNLYSTKIS